MKSIDILCIIYYICSYIQTIPQVVKLIKTKSSHDYSLGQLILQFIGLTCWSIFIFLGVNDIIVYIGTVIDYVLLLVVDALIIKYYKIN